MMSGKAAICQVCCWENICHNEKIWTKDTLSPVDKAGKNPAYAFLSCASCVLLGCFNCSYGFSSCIHCSSTMLVFMEKKKPTIFSICQAQLLLASYVRLNTQHLSLGVGILVVY